MNRMLRGRRARRGFTLIELLVVVLILGVLLAVAIPLYLTSVKNASTQTVKANLKTMGLAAQAYFVKNGTYPATEAAIVGATSDLQYLPTGPRGVTYSLVGTATTCVVTATETGQDAFDTTGVADTGTYTVQTGAYSASLP